MNTRFQRLARRSTILACSAVYLCCASPGWGGITAEHQRQIDEVRIELNKAQTLANKKQFDEAAAIVDEAEKKLKVVVQDAGIDDRHKLVVGLFRLIEQRRAAIARRSAATRADVSPTFERDVAPILVTNCLECHSGANPRGGFSMENFDGLVRGGKSRVIVPGNAAASELVQRITTTGSGRMPRDADPLSPDEQKKIAGWVSAGAKFNGNNATPLAELVATATPRAKDDKAPATIARPTGGETVSFVRDIAPFMVNLCLDCHSGKNARSGFSLETFEKLMAGGKSGKVVVPGSLGDSRLWQLVGEQNPIKMPQGQARITRTNHSNLRTWLQEGAKFDGPDVRAPLRRLVPTAEEERAKALAGLSDEELASRRHARAVELWQGALSTESPNEHQSERLITIGNASEARLLEIAAWADEDLRSLQKYFHVKDDQLWRGKLTLFVFKDRFSYSEFVQTTERVEIPAETKGHARVDAGQEDSYVCLQDVGDAEEEGLRGTPGARALLTTLIAEALLHRLPRRIPEWASRGAGLALAAKHDPRNAYFHSLASAAREALSQLDKPQTILDEGALAPADLSPIGYTLVAHMMKLAGEPQFAQFVGLLGSGKPLSDALRTVYRADRASLVQSYMAGLSASRPASPKRRKAGP